MKSFVNKKDVPTRQEELEKLSVGELIKIRLFTLKGSNTKAEKRAIIIIDDLLCAKTDEFTLDDLTHIMEVRSFKHAMCTRQQRTKGVGSAIITAYNDTLRRLVPADHPFRYRYIVKDFLDKDNARTETVAWLIGNSHYGPGWYHKEDIMKEIIKDASIEELNLLADKLIRGKAHDSKYLLTRMSDLNPDLVQRIMKFTVIDVGTYLESIQPKVFILTTEFIAQVAPTRVLSTLCKLGMYHNFYVQYMGTGKAHGGVRGGYEIVNQLTKDEMAKTLFPFTSSVENTKYIEGIIKAFYGDPNA